MPLRFEITYQSSDYTKRLEREIVEAKEKVKEAERKCNMYDFKYRNVMNLNFELIELLHQNGTPFRDITRLHDINNW